MYNDAIWVDPLQLKHVPNNFKMQETCDNVVRDDPRTLLFVPDWFVTQQQLKLWHYCDDYCNDDDDEDKLYEW